MWLSGEALLCSSPSRGKDLLVDSEGRNLSKVLQCNAYVHGPVQTVGKLGHVENAHVAAE
jgi:hypothetical protein